MGMFLTGQPRPHPKEWGHSVPQIFGTPMLFGHLSFTVAGSTFWNSLADELRTYSSDRFKLLNFCLHILACAAH